MTLVLRHFGFSLHGKLIDDDVLSLGAKNVATLKLSPQPDMEKACIFYEEEDQNKEKHKEKQEKKKKQKEGKEKKAKKDH